MSRSRALPVAALLLAFAAAACSSGGSDKGGGSGQPANATGDLRVAQQAVLRPSDLRDYKAATHTAASEIRPALKKKFAQCMGTSTTIFDKVPGAQSADSPDFSKGEQNQQQVTSGVEIEPS